MVALEVIAVGQKLRHACGRSASNESHWLKSAGKTSAPLTILHGTTSLLGIVYFAFFSSAPMSAAEPSAITAEQRNFFEQRIRPVLVMHCYKCHSEKAKELKGKLRLDSRDGMIKGGESGAVILAGKPEKSRLIKALEYDGLEMPPAGKLPRQVTADFREWIRAGAVDPRQRTSQPKIEPKVIDPVAARGFWSLRDLVRPPAPQVAEEWARNPIDRFIADKQIQAGIKPGKNAKPARLARRAYFDLTGLPPPPEIEAFAERYSDAEYEKLVDRLLKSPQFGERWARYWLDIARFAESSGFEQDHDRPHAWPYRDFVIRALNEDMPYDEFVRLQIAGDHLQPGDDNASVATGFVVAGVENLIQTRKDFVQQRYDKLDDMVSTVGTAFLGLSLGCARCHDHKYDPLTQREYYRVAAAFAATVSGVKEMKVRGFKAYVATEAAEGRIRMVVISEPSAKDLPSIPATVHFLVRGDPTNQREIMPVGFPSVLVRGDNHSGGGPPVAGRVAVARWITDTQNGAGQLLARVIVNRLWQHHFGRGLVATPSDFGARGERPTHPELLDWLAAELIENQWRLKHIHKLIMMSSVYRQAFRSAADGREVARYEKQDPHNSLLWRREPRRLDAEAIRDNLLSVSGRLDPKIYGPGGSDPNHPRRSLYLKVKRSKLVPVLQLFDAPDTLQGVGRRPTTTTAPQGLMMLNSPFVDACSTAFAVRLQKMEPANDEEYVRNGFLLAVGRRPSLAEMELCRQMLQPDTPEKRRDFCQMLFCLNEFIYIE